MEGRRKRVFEWGNCILTGWDCVCVCLCVRGRGRGKEMSELGC